jgi:hypothetical protein
VVIIGLCSSRQEVEMKCLQSSEATVYSSVVDIKSYAKIVVYVSCHAKLEVGFVDCVEEVSHNDQDIDSFAMLNKSFGSRLWFWITCAYPDGIEGCLSPSCD